MKETAVRHRAPTREIFGWAMFDFANSAYTTVIITVIYGVVYSEIIVGPDAAGGFRRGNLYWSIALAAGYGLVVLTAPLLGAMMDYSAARKKFLFASYLFTVSTTAMMYFIGPQAYMAGMLLIILSNFGFSVGESFVSSFLPYLGPPEELGKISGYAWGLGYFGGLASMLLVARLGPVQADNYVNLRFVGPVTAAFFLLAAVPTFLWVKEPGSPRALPAGKSYFTVGFSRLAETFRSLRAFRDLMVFLVSVFFAMAGLSIVVSFAFIYGNQVVRWDETARTLMFVITQFTAAGGAVLFGVVQDRIGAKKTFNITLVLWVAAVLLIWRTPELTRSLNELLGTSWREQTTFLWVGCLAGLGLGATQSASRAIVGIFSPESKSGEFFGFWGLSGKLAAIVGILGLGLLQARLGLQSAILMCTCFFLAALLINLAVDEERGKLTASRYDEKTH